MEEKLLSVIVPMYNDEEYIIRCLESLQNQDIEKDKYEIILINDGSQDKTLEYAENFSRNYKNIKIITQENGGASVARNRGIDEAVGKYIWFVDGDDYVVENRMGILLEKAIGNDLDILSFDTGTSKKIERISVETKEGVELGKVYNGIEYIENVQFGNMVWKSFFKTKFLKETGVRFIKGRYSQDAMFKIEVLSFANRVAFFPLCSYIYFINPDSAAHSKEKNHYTKMIEDYLFVADFFSDFIERMKKEKKDISEKCIRRLETRKESFVFFLMVRLLKSQLTYSQVMEEYKILKDKGYLPLRNFIGIDYGGLEFTTLTYIFNRENIFKILLRLFELKNKVFSR